MPFPVKTNIAFAQLFSGDPEWLRELTLLDFPETQEADPVKFKEVEREADLVPKPKDPKAPHHGYPKETHPKVPGTGIVYPP